MTAAFLDLPQRSHKPRTGGVTHVLDKLAPLRLLNQWLDQCCEFVDILKVGWGLGYLDANLAERAAICARHGVTLCTGGTLLEIAAHQGRVAQFHEWALASDVRAVEVSNGLGLLTRQAKHELVTRLCGDFVILAETGRKSGTTIADGKAWADEMLADLDAGATWVVAEGRETGTAGMYQPDGAVRGRVVSEVVAVVDPRRIIFEAPRKDQQAWLVERLGANVGLGNVGLSDVCGVESLRLGLRADTANSVVPVVLP